MKKKIVLYLIYIALLIFVGHKFMTDYREQGYNEYLEKPLAAPAPIAQGFSAIDFDSLLESGAIDTEQLAKALIKNEHLQQAIIKNANIQVESRGWTAVVAADGSGDFGNLWDATEYVNKQGGGRILVMPGTYLINQNITLYDDISIEGLSKNDVILDFNGGTNSIRVDTINNIILKEMTLKNNHNITDGTIYLNTVKRINIENIIFKDNRLGSSGYDIYAKEDVGLITIQRCQAENGATFFAGETDPNAGSVYASNIISGNRIEGYNNYVLSSLGAGTGLEQIIIEKNRVIDSTKGFIYGRLYFSGVNNNMITGDIGTGEAVLNFIVSNNNSFVGNYITTDEMILNLDSGGGKFVNNYFKTTGAITALDIEANNCYFTNNDIRQEGSSGNTIDLAAADCYFSSNNIYSKNGSCIIVGASAHFCAFGANKIRALGGYAVDIVSGATATTVVGNYLEGSTADTRDNGTNSVIAHNGT